jgi:hypothetical protein
MVGTHLSDRLLTPAMKLLLNVAIGSLNDDPFSSRLLLGGQPPASEINSNGNNTPLRGNEAVAWSGTSSYPPRSQVK